MKLYIWDGKHSVALSKADAIDDLTGRYYQHLLATLDKRDEMWKIYNFDQYTYEMSELYQKRLSKVIPFEFDMKSIGGISYK